jgi:hypothetical protein
VLRSFRDSADREWKIVDYRVVDFKKKRVPLGDWRAEGRAFVPIDRDGPVMIHNFGYTPYRDTDNRTLQRQLDVAKPSTASAAERMQR